MKNKNLPANGIELRRPLSKSVKLRSHPADGNTYDIDVDP